MPLSEDTIQKIKRHIKLSLFGALLITLLFYLIALTLDFPLGHLGVFFLGVFLLASILGILIKQVFWWSSLDDIKDFFSSTSAKEDHKESKKLREAKKLRNVAFRVLLFVILIATYSSGVSTRNTEIVLLGALALVLTFYEKKNTKIVSREEISRWPTGPSGEFQPLKLLTTGIMVYGIYIWVWSGHPRIMFYGMIASSLLFIIQNRGKMPVEIEV